MNIHTYVKGKPLRFLLLLGWASPLGLQAVEGWFYHSTFPYIWSADQQSWYTIADQESGLTVWDYEAAAYIEPDTITDEWIYSSRVIHPWAYSYTGGRWLYLQTSANHLYVKNLNMSSWDHYGESYSGSPSYPIVDTAQVLCYDNEGAVINPPADGQPFHGQDAQYSGNSPSYMDNGDGTVTDLVTGLMWQQGYGVQKLSYDEALAGAEAFDLAGYDDWRLPTIKELWSIFQYDGKTGFSENDSIPFIDTVVFPFAFGDTASGERFIDAQYVSSTVYAGTTMNNSATVFGVNFADGRIKGYPMYGKDYYVKYVRGNPDYGVNEFVDNGDGTVTDLATGLMWMKVDSGHLEAGPFSDGTMTWEDALAWAETLVYAGYDDWRLPDGKELQSIVDYSRAPQATNPAQRGPAVDPVFDISNEQSYFWTSSTHVEAMGGNKAAYVCFGQAFGYMPDPYGNYRKIDVHGAGAVRSDPKTGDPAEYPYGHGPQGDDIRIYNYVRLVR